MLLTFLIAMLALIIAVLVGAAVNPRLSWEVKPGHEGSGAPDWKGSI